MATFNEPISTTVHQHDHRAYDRDVHDKPRMTPQRRERLRDLKNLHPWAARCADATTAAMIAVACAGVAFAEPSGDAAATDTPAQAQQQTDDTESTERADASDTPDTDEAVLAGPAVDDEDAGTQRTLVEYGFDGSLEYVPGGPIMGAVRLLDLTEAQREAIETTLDERAALVDGVVLEHFELFNHVRETMRAGRAKTSEERRERAQLFREVRGAIEPMTAQGTIEDVVASALPASQRDEFERLVDEYRAAQQREREERRAGEMDSSRDSMQGPDAEPDEQRQERLRRFREERERRRSAPADRERSFGEMRVYLEEIGQSARRIVDSQRANAEAFYESIDATPEQRSQIQAIIRDAVEGIEQADQNGRRNAIRQAMPEILELLTPEQRRVLAEQRRRR